MRFVRNFFMVIGVIATMATIGGIIAALMFRGRALEVPDKTLLQLELDQGLVEYLPDDPWTLLTLGRRGLSLRHVVTAIERAAADERVVGLVVYVDSAGLGLATVQELRQAIATFRGAGKPAVVHAESFGEFSAGNSSYYLASGFDKIYLQPSGDVGLTGLLAQSFFLKGTFEKLGIDARLDNREEYKGVKDIFTERKFTGPQREALTAVLASLSDQMIDGIGKARGLSREQIHGITQRAPLTAKEGLEAQLVDALLYRDEVQDRVEKELGADAEVLSLAAYFNRLATPAGDAATVALIYGIGQIQRGRSEYSPFTEKLSMGSATIVSAFRAAIEDEDVQAILFRVDSPGGSYVASDTMWREVVRAREHGKPVVVSMGNVAGSGGYFVAAPADKIVAQPATITGSIGVAAGKMVTAGFWDKLGVSWDAVSTNPNATFWSSIDDYSPEQWSRLEHLLDAIYDDFVAKVAQGRKLSKKEVLAVAKGRIWTGADAKERGLVDALGGYATALQMIRDVANIPTDSRIALKVFPERKSTLQLLLDRLLGAERDDTSIAIVAPWTLRRLRDLAGPMPEARELLSMVPLHIH